MSQPDQGGARPRPQFGEYATAEEQRRRIQQPDATWALESGRQAVAEPAPMADAPPPGPPTPEAEDDPARSEQTRRRRFVDRVITMGLLVYGLINVVSSIPLFTDYGAYAETLFDMMGIDAALSDPEGARIWGLAAAIVLGLGWLLTAVTSWASLRRGRASWWIPLVGALVFSFASGILLTVPLFQDPAVWDVLVSGASG
ncbi:DUF6264 family protein [Microbacterium xanthum]|uniref:DUF6264 family protein n=1 Tax=Microbacterium xanthum TaxID=3079794 RepID=UPI002AD3EA64|nr:MULTISPECIES: DUF6264 family protein [unclassified Microbacterium]MDZ8172093.1 DUF6264 family protein [Microbacterium sp. KSW-48]MDZ8202200.1 DUF6264 family protein [Microbacterium sp. SSW1-59]